jgi:hypothetical protein
MQAQDDVLETALRRMAAETPETMQVMVDVRGKR